ncbi:hypothetical protein CDL12_27977 [Handroanthus impetiginosus]|uniref:Trichome birefringence-like C-terminal domain-containing protein n=1 Tax=Handroanthus impetiginosus TaxID=429701 RepID=A0A2G9G3P5_9LAMI|nr:hypothetical protein CDL12_27977 [Handroanthus impetiginosus]
MLYTLKSKFLDGSAKYRISFPLKLGVICGKKCTTRCNFEGGDWDQGGTCSRSQPLAPQEAEQLFSLKNNGTNVETRLVNQHLHKALKDSNFRILDITHMSEFRADTLKQH